MEQKTINRQWLGFIFVGIFGVLLHYLYDWSYQSPVVSFFSGVNESTWEHMKLLYFPMIVYALWEGRILKAAHPDFWCVKLRGILLGLVAIPVLFYTLNGVFGPTPDWVNIAIYYAAAGAAFWYESRLFQKGLPCTNPKSAKIALWALGVAFVLFTFRTPQIPLFRDPLDGSYGIELF